MAESARPRMPMPAATGTDSARRPTSSASVMPSMSAARPGLPRLEVADLVLDLLLGGTRADRPRHALGVAAHGQGQRVHEQEHARDDEPEQADDPQELREHHRR